MQEKILECYKYVNAFLMSNYHLLILKKRTMKNALILFSFLIFVSLFQFNLMAQSSFVTAGCNSSSSGGNLCFSIGQLVYTSFTGSNGKVIQGVQQPYEQPSSGSKNESIYNPEIFVFPNPVHNEIFIDRSIYQESQLISNIYDLTGKMVQSNSLTTDIEKINISGLSQGIYFLQIIDNTDNKIIQSIQLIKN